jgi:hypothetical protein
MAVRFGHSGGCSEWNAGAEAFATLNCIATVVTATVAPAPSDEINCLENYPERHPAEGQARFRTPDSFGCIDGEGSFTPRAEPVARKPDRSCPRLLFDQKITPTEPLRRHRSEASGFVDISGLEFRCRSSRRPFHALRPRKVAALRLPLNRRGQIEPDQPSRAPAPPPRLVRS